jgi:hypothetical protein
LLWIFALPVTVSQYPVKIILKNSYVKIHFSKNLREYQLPFVTPFYKHYIFANRNPNFWWFDDQYYVYVICEKESKIKFNKKLYD